MNASVGDHDMPSPSEAAVPHYFVELNEHYLKDFEQFSSLCSLDEYEQLLYLLEEKFVAGRVAIPPGDVIVVLLTLATASSHYKADFVRANDPYNVGRTDIAHRSMRLLSRLVDAVEEFDDRRYMRFELELLRCQLFLFLDSIVPKRPEVTIAKRVRTHGKNQPTDIPFAPDEMPLCVDSLRSASYKYVSVLETKKAVFQNVLLTHVLSQNGGFWNCVAWTLSTMIDKDAVKNYCGETWFPIVTFLFRLYELRHAYYMQYEMTQGISSAAYTKELADSPLVLLFKSLGSNNVHITLCDYLFVNCGKNVGRGEARPVYHSELKLSATYVPFCKPSTEWKLFKSMQLRRRILSCYFKVLADIPKDHRIKPFSEDQSIKYMVRTLLELETVEMFQAFFFTDDLKITMHYLPLLAEHIIVVLLEDCGKAIESTLVTNLGNLDVVIENIEEYLEMRPVDCSNAIGLHKTVFYIDTCTLVLIKYAILLHGTDVLLTGGLDMVLKRFFKEESKLLDTGSLEHDYPRLSPYLKILFNV
ncbi:AER324Cp [Eremothecium gossypii ATCC 10895]|uniref:AER324Cp n=1 Tax=Eremothecium gossypii (strain ATCC 10895 / CBS 109.51 / FGSC 9923 / NRRL Y-1056) TaxID=284811 RepID=Q756F5_EREGS|nr:AER324Cp [Eremothecium gossypii ATCC 10895]AAS53004.2 AER324Cp [Eremothecium gossypii ATCC 10895]AEY97312.1 FAER324Cp [Eremothecium gossypii FDAG1]